MYIQEAIGIALVISALAAPVIVIWVIHYLRKRLEHKQILAAIEKGTDLSGLVRVKPAPTGPAWIRFVSTGVTLLIISLGFVGNHSEARIVGCIIGGVGAGWLVRGLLHRRYYLRNGAGQNGGSEAKAGV